MKIGITGTHGTGKTTLLYKIAEYQKSKDPGSTVNILAEVARRSPGRINKESSRENQEWIHLQQYCAEIEGEMNTDVLVCDRTVLDSLAYTAVLGYDLLFNKHIKNAMEWMKTYDIVYFLRPDCKFMASDDGVRSVDIRFRNDVDAEIERVLAWYKIGYISQGGGKMSKHLIIPDCQITPDTPPARMAGKISGLD